MVRPMRLVSFRHADAAEIRRGRRRRHRRSQRALAEPARRDRGQGAARAGRRRQGCQGRSPVRRCRARCRPFPTPTRSSASASTTPATSARSAAQLPTVPSVFSRLHNTLVPHGGNIVRPRASTNFDFEGELAVVIGERCRHVPRASALSVVAGYTCFLDVSVRDFQKHSVTAGKNFPATGPLGPWMVTADVIARSAAARAGDTAQRRRSAARHDRSHDLRRRHHHRIPLDRDLAGAGRRHRHRHARRRRPGPQAAALDEGRRQGRGRDLRHRDFAASMSSTSEPLALPAAKAGWQRDAKVIARSRRSRISSATSTSCCCRRSSCW